MVIRNVKLWFDKSNTAMVLRCVPVHNPNVDVSSSSKVRKETVILFFCLPGLQELFFVKNALLLNLKMYKLTRHWIIYMLDSTSGLYDELNTFCD